MAAPFVSSRRPKESHSLGQQLCKIIGTKESVYLRKRSHSRRIGLGHQHGGCDVMRKTLYKVAVRNVLFSGGWGVGGGGGGCFALPPQVEFLPRLDQRGHCHWPLFLTAQGCTKFHQGGVPTLVRSGKVFGRQRGHRHWPVSSFLAFFTLILFFWGVGVH